MGKNIFSIVLLRVNIIKTFEFVKNKFNPKEENICFSIIKLYFDNYNLLP